MIMTTINNYLLFIIVTAMQDYCMEKSNMNWPLRAWSINFISISNCDVDN